MHKVRSFVTCCGLLIMALISGCDAPPTPLPPDAFLVTDVTATPDAIAPAARYGLTANFAALYPNWQASYAAEQVEILPDDAGDAAPVDLVLGLGRMADAEVIGQLTLGYVVDRRVQPLDNATLYAAVISTFSAEALSPEEWNAEAIAPAGVQPAQTREQLANAGYPDGISLTAAMPEELDAQRLIDTFSLSNIRLLPTAYAPGMQNAILERGGYHLVIAAWTDATAAELQTLANAESLHPILRVPVMMRTRVPVSLNSYGLPILNG